MCLATSAVLAAQNPLPQPAEVPADLTAEIHEAIVRLPLAAILGTALALRPKRRSTPTRTPAVVQTQIILSVVGALVMLVVGASLARAFGIVGAANLVRYRSKIDDPKDAGVMLCSLAVGLAAGVGAYGLAVFATVFIVGSLAIIESFEPRTVKRFLLHVKINENAGALRPKVESALERLRLKHELRTTSDEELGYEVGVPFEMETDRITDLIARSCGRGTDLTVEWEQKKAKE
jgi:uncharacterized membrane protein YhiD involved in acid resistance